MAEKPIGTVRADALERLEEWVDDESRSYKIIRPSGGNVAYIRLFWADGRCCHVVTADGTGYMSTDPLQPHAPWHHDKVPARLAATIHAAINAALDAGEKVETELSNP